MQTSRRVWPILIGLAFLFLWFNPYALAQSDDRLASLSIQVRPEFDQPNVLVLYSGEVAAKEKLPRDISLLVPTGAELFATAYVGADDKLLNTEPATTKDEGNGFTRVTFKLPAPKFQIEFYYNPLQGNPDKKMDFVYQAAQAADQVELLILEPLKAENFTTVPSSVVQTSTTHNFKQHIFNYASVTANQVLRVQISYRKTDPNPSIANVEAPAPTPAPADTQSTTSSPLLQIALMLVVAALALVALAAFAWWSRRPGHAMPFVSARNKATGFCTQCGHALVANDNFCPRCGTSRKRA